MLTVTPCSPPYTTMLTVTPIHHYGTPVQAANHVVIFDR